MPSSWFSEVWVNSAISGLVWDESIGDLERPARLGHELVDQGLGRGLVVLGQGGIARVPEGVLQREVLGGIRPRRGDVGDRRSVDSQRQHLAHPQVVEGRARGCWASAGWRRAAARSDERAVGLLDGACRPSCGTIV